MGESKPLTERELECLDERTRDAADEVEDVSVSPGQMRRLLAELRALRAERAASGDLLAALRDCVDGLGSQPGYLSALAIRRAEIAVGKAERAQREMPLPTCAPDLDAAESPGFWSR